MQENCHESSKIPDGMLITEHSESNIFPYLLVNIGSGVSMVEVTPIITTTVDCSSFFDN